MVKVTGRVEGVRELNQMCYGPAVTVVRPGLCLSQFFCHNTHLELRVGDMEGERHELRSLLF